MIIWKIHETIVLYPRQCRRKILNELMTLMYSNKIVIKTKPINILSKFDWISKMIDSYTRPRVEYYSSLKKLRNICCPRTSLNTCQCLRMIYATACQSTGTVSNNKDTRSGHIEAYSEDSPQIFCFKCILYVFSVVCNHSWWANITNKWFRLSPDL